MSKVKAAIAQGAKGIGLDLGAMMLTENGFVPAKKVVLLMIGISRSRPELIVRDKACYQ
jgi:hypothetical protein